MKAPTEIPSELINQYTLDNKIEIEHLYFNEVHDCSIEYNIDEFNKLINTAKNKGSGNYPLTDPLIHNSFEDFPIRNKNIVIMGSGYPWYEAICIAYECKSCTVIEYQKRILKDNRIQYLTPYEYEKNPIKYDCGISISSFEHDGLGRYGDPLDPNGDLKAMLKMKDILVKNGLLFLAVPVSKDKLVWNAHRIYGNIRLPLLLNNWELVKTYGFDPNYMNIDTKSCGANQPLFILRNN